MRIDVRPRGLVQVLVVTGTDGGDCAEALRRRLAALLDAGEFLFIVNLSRGPAPDSALLGELVAERERVRKRQGAVKLVVNRAQRELLASGRLDRLFEVFDDEDDALDSFAAWSSTAGIP